MVRQNWYVRSILTSVLLLLVFSVSGTAQGSPDPFDADSLTPSELHQILAERKAVALQKARDMRALAETEAKSPSAQTNYDVRFYDIWIRVNDTINVIYGKVTFVADAAEASVSSVDVDLYSNMTIDSIVSPGGLLTFSRAGNVVTVNLGQAYNQGEQFEFDFWYHGTPVTGGFQAFEFGSYNGDPAITTLSEPYFARTWWPCKDRMDDKADSFYTHIEVDTGLFCASNGTLDSVTAASSRSHTYHHTMRYPMVTYLFSLAIHPYVVWTQDYIYNSGADTMPIVHHVYPDWDSYSRPRWGLTPDIMEVLSSNYGPYPFLEHRYGHANFNWGGGMEHQTMTSMTGSSFGFNQYIVAHEMGHQWWGDMITCESWQDIWLNEGWASYSEALWALSQGGWPEYHSYMNSMAYYGSGTIWVEPSDTNSVWSIFNSSLSYDKAAWVCHMLRGVLGDFKFFQGVQAYYNSEHQHGSATTEDFKNVFEAATGEELDWFFDEWIYGQRYPDYEYEFLSEASDSSGFDTYLYVKQKQTSTPQVFHMPVDFFFNYSTTPDDTITLACDDREKFFRINGPSQVLAVSLDPSGWILKNATQVAWKLHIITFEDELSDGLLGQPYQDTVEFRGGTGASQVSLTIGSLPDGLSINNQGVITGTPTLVDNYFFNVRVFNPTTGYADTARFNINVSQPPTCCTGPSVGNLDGSPDNEVSLSDLTILIDHLFVSLAPLSCVDEGNLDQDPANEVNLADLGVMIDYLFITLTPLPPCPSN